MYTRSRQGGPVRYYKLVPQRVLVVRLTLDGDTITRISLDLAPLSTLKGRPISPTEELVGLLTQRVGYRVARENYTPFQQRVLDQVQKIPYGATTTYAAIARAVGCNSPRPIGQALAANRTPLVIPCHRVVRTDGSLGGFSQGIDIKRLLLRFEHENRSDE